MNSIQKIVLFLLSHKTGLWKEKGTFFFFWNIFKVILNF